MRWRNLLLLTMVTAAISAAGCATAAPRTGGQPLEVVHPSLLFRKSDIAQMKRTIAALPEAKTRWERMLADTDPSKALEYPVPGAATQPDWARVSGRVGGLAARCGVLYQLTGQRRYAEWARKMLLGWGREFHTRVDFRLCGDYRGTELGHAGEGGNNMGYYMVGHLLTNTALAYDCIWETLSPEDRATIERNYFGNWVAAIESFDSSKRMPGKAPDFMIGGGQWNGANLCNMGLTATGFVLGDRRLIERGLRNFKLYLGRDLLSDGFWIEEDRAYSDTCMATLFAIAWMAHSSGYGEDLFYMVVKARPRESYDRRYYVALPSCDGPAPAERSLSMYLDAQIDYQYPNLEPGNWGWLPGRGSLKRSGALVGMYGAGHVVYGKPGYAFILENVDLGRSRLGAGGLDLFYFGRKLDRTEPPESRSRWYPHGRWLVLKSIEGRRYWNSDSLYAFLPYGTERTKGLLPLTLDIFAFGRVLAPRTTITDFAQNLTKPYQLNEPAWNTVMIDGCILNTFRGRSDKTHLAYHDFGPLVKVAAPRVHWIGERRTELDTPNVERHGEEDCTLGRTLAMTDTYLVDVFSVTYDRRPKYKHNFDYVLHGKGELAFESSGSSGGRFADQVATWRQEDGVGLRSTITTAMPRGGTKLKKYTGPRGEFLVATRGNYEEWFAVVHEPFKGKPRIAEIKQLADQPDAVALEIHLAGGTVDLLALRTKDTKKSYAWRSTDGRTLALKGNYTLVRRHNDGRIERQEK